MNCGGFEIESDVLGARKDRSSVGDFQSLFVEGTSSDELMRIIRLVFVRERKRRRFNVNRARSNKGSHEHSSGGRRLQSGAEPLKEVFLAFRKTKSSHHSSRGEEGAVGGVEIPEGEKVAPVFEMCGDREAQFER